MIRQQLIEELKMIIKEAYGENVNLKEVSEIAHNLVNYFNLLAKIHHREEILKNKYENNEITNR